MSVKHAWYLLLKYFFYIFYIITNIHNIIEYHIFHIRPVNNLKYTMYYLIVEIYNYLQ